MEFATVAYFVIVLQFVAICLHALGIYGLHRAQRLREIHKYFLKTISTYEIFILILQSIISASYAMKNARMQHFIPVLQIGSILAWTLILLFFTVNRYLEVRLHLRYTTCVTLKRVKLAVAATTFIGVIVTSLTVFLHFFTSVDVLSTAYIFIFPAFELAFLIVCIYVYHYIFKMINTKPRTHTLGTIEENGVIKQTLPRTPMTRRKMKRQRFEKRARTFIPFYIILTFLIFFGVPEFTTMLVLHILHYDHLRAYVILPSLVVYLVGYACDAFIYIIMIAEVRELLLRKLRQITTYFHRTDDRKQIKA